ncbi:MAG: MalY/PatB family protein [Candidatus Methylomirabilales bacterium]
MSFDFDECVPRRGTGCEKYDGLLQRFGRADLQPFWVADMDFRSPGCVREALAGLVEHGVYGYALKTEATYRAICEWFARRHATRVDPASIVFTPGVVAALNCLVQAFTAPGEGILIQPPVYHPFFSAVRGNDRRLLENPLIEQDNRYQMDYGDLEAKARDAKLLILCSPHNPVGRVWTRRELERVADICLRHGVRIVSDEIHNDLVFPPHRHVPLASLAPEVARITITCHAPSKTFNLPGLGTAYVLIPDEGLRATFRGFMDRLHVDNLNVFGLRALEAAYTAGEPWLEALLAYLSGNACRVREHLAAWARVRLSPLEGTYLMWMDFREYRMPPEDLRRALVERAGLALNDGRMFGAGGAGFQRLNIGCPRACLAQGLDRLKTALG